MEDMPNDRDTKVLIPYGLSGGHAQGEKSAYSPLKTSLMSHFEFTEHCSLNRGRQGTWVFAQNDMTSYVSRLFPSQKFIKTLDFP